MKNLKRTLGLLTAVLAFCMVFALNVKVDAAAENQEIQSESMELQKAVSLGEVTTDSFMVTYTSSTSIGVTVVKPTDVSSVEVVLMDFNGSVVDSYNAYSYASFYNLTPNRLYYVKARTRTYASGQYSYGTWSGLRAVTTVVGDSLKMDMVKNTMAVSLKAPKVNGVKNYTIYMSKQQESGYKKVRVIKPGKKVKLSNFRGKSFGYYKSYYIYLVPNLTSGIKCDMYPIRDFFIRKVYK